MNWIDYIVIFYLAARFVGGLKKGLMFIVINAVCFLSALILSFYTYGYSANYLVSNFSLSEGYANVAGFFANLIVFRVISMFLAREIFLNGIPSIGNSFLNRASGAIVSVAYGILIVFLLFSIALSFSFPFFMEKEIRSSFAGKMVGADPLGANDKIKKIFGEVLSSAVNMFDFLTLEESESDKKIELGFKTEDFVLRETLENEMLKLINGERKSAGLDEYVMDDALKEVARKYGGEMLKSGNFSHTDLEGKKPADRMKDGGVKFNFSGENLAYSKDLLAAHAGLMNSESHRKNILHPLFHRIGIGVLDAGARGMIFVQNFAD